MKDFFSLYAYKQKIRWIDILHTQLQDKIMEYKSILHICIRIVDFELPFFHKYDMGFGNKCIPVLDY